MQVCERKVVVLNLDDIRYFDAVCRENKNIHPHNVIRKTSLTIKLTYITNSSTSNTMFLHMFFFFFPDNRYFVPEGLRKEVLVNDLGSLYPGTLTVQYVK